MYKTACADYNDSEMEDATSMTQETAQMAIIIEQIDASSVEKLTDAVGKML